DKNNPREIIFIHRGQTRGDATPLWKSLNQVTHNSPERRTTTAQASGLGLLHRALPAVDVTLARTTHRQGGGRHLAGDHRTGGGGGTVADGDWRHQRVVGADEGIHADDGAVLVGAVVVAGDGTGADVAQRTD